MVFEGWEGLVSYPQGFCIIYDVNPRGYEARPPGASKSIQNTLGTHGFAKSCVPIAFFMLF
jgi:hypothetical protein